MTFMMASPCRSAPESWGSLPVKCEVFATTIDLITALVIQKGLMVAEVEEKPKYLEDLPQEVGAPCPPDGAEKKSYDALWRYVDADPPTLSGFASHAALGKTRNPVVSACRWSSCSFFMVQNSTYRALPKPRKKYKYIARVSITAECGMSKPGDIHLDFWPFANFAPNVQEVIAL
jgi:hypothetical protein